MLSALEFRILSSGHGTGPSGSCVGPKSARHRWQRSGCDTGVAELLIDPRGHVVQDIPPVPP